MEQRGCCGGQCRHCVCVRAAQGGELSRDGYCNSRPLRTALPPRALPSATPPLRTSPLLTVRLCGGLARWTGAVICMARVAPSKVQATGRVRMRKAASKWTRASARTRSQATLTALCSLPRQTNALHPTPPLAIRAPRIIVHPQHVVSVSRSHIPVSTCTVRGSVAAA